MKFSLQKSGFTLVETVMVIALMVLLLVATLQSIIGSTAQFTFINTSDQVLDLIRQARSLAISGKAQLDYTDFDKDTCNDMPNSLESCQSQDYAIPALGRDYVTPAHYGIHFHRGSGVDDPPTVTLFADNHEVNGSPYHENEYNDDLLISDPLSSYHLGGDFTLQRVTLPNDIHFTKLPASDVTIFYSPLFADLSFDTEIPALDTPFFKFSLSQILNNETARSRCYEIHTLAGIPELYPCPAL